MRCIAVDSQLYGDSMLCPILSMFDIDGELTTDLGQAVTYIVMLANGDTSVVTAPRWRVVEKKLN